MKIGTDCSGLDTPIYTLQKMGIPFTHVWSCDNNIYCKKTIFANYKPEHFYDDITKRDYENLPDIDLYICGFPCQPYSLLNLYKKENDPRKDIIHYVLKTIDKKRPKYFILENVRNFNANSLEKICKERFPEYHIQVLYLNTKNYGLPQNRPRMYLIGTKDKVVLSEYPYQEIPPLEDFVDFSDTESRPLPDCKKSYSIDERTKEYIFLNIITPSKTHKFHKNKRVSPCVLAHSSLWNVPLHRYANNFELFALQGFNPDEIKQVVSKTQLRRQIGNAMSVNVLEFIFKQLFIDKNH